MITKKEIKKLSELARVGLADSEAEKLQKDLVNILDFISKLKEAQVSEIEEEMPELRNVLRDDESPHESAENTAILMKQVPDQEKGYVKVKKIR